MTVAWIDVFNAVAPTSLHDAAGATAADRVIALIDADAARPEDADKPGTATTAADLDALPVGSLVMGGPPGRWAGIMGSDGRWFVTGESRPRTAAEMVAGGYVFRVMRREGIDR